MEFWSSVMLFLVAGLPVFLVGVLPAGIPLLQLRRVSRLPGRLLTPRSLSVLDASGVLVTFVLAYFWWGSFCYSIIVQPLFEVDTPFIEVFLACALTSNYVGFLRSFRRARSELIRRYDVRGSQERITDDE